jgi:hypothetical protein
MSKKRDERRRARQALNAAQNRNKGAEENTPTDDPSAPPVSPAPVVVNTNTGQKIADSQTSNPNNRPNEAQIAEYTRSLSNWTKGLVFVGIATVAVLTLQLCTLDKSDETLRAEQRPWMQFAQLDFVAPLHCDRGAAKTRVKLMLNNAGHSPALHVNTFISMSVDVRDILGGAEKQRRMCEPERTAPVTYKNIGRAVFPGLERAEGEYDLAAPQAMFVGPYLIFPSIMACINYKFPFGGAESHQTGLIWNITLKSQRESPAPEKMIIPCSPTQPDISPGDLDKFVSPIGSYAD